MRWYVLEKKKKDGKKLFCDKESHNLARMEKKQFQKNPKKKKEGNLANDER